VIFGQQSPCDIALTAADMGMHVDSAGHHDLAFQVIFLVNLHIQPGFVDDTPVLYVNILLLAVNPVCRIVDFTTC
jgi:hypothetical protein